MVQNVSCVLLSIWSSVRFWYDHVHLCFWSPKGQWTISRTPPRLRLSTYLVLLEGQSMGLRESGEWIMRCQDDPERRGAILCWFVARLPGESVLNAYLNLLHHNQTSQRLRYRKYPGVLGWVWHMWVALVGYKYISNVVSVKRGVHKGSYDWRFLPCHISCRSRGLIVSICKRSVR